MVDCWLTLDDDLASRFHARFHVGAETLELEDLNSRNGTYLNGEKVEGRVPLQDGDQLRIGREVIAVIGPGQSSSRISGADELRRTIGPGEETQFPNLIGQLVEKSLSMGKTKDAERYALALTNQLMSSKVEGDHPTAVSCIKCLIALAEKTSSGVWLDRVFKLHAVHGWVMTGPVLADLRKTLNYIPRVPGSGIEDYEWLVAAPRDQKKGRALRASPLLYSTLGSGLTCRTP
jgi:hypothetical protein